MVEVAADVVVVGGGVIGVFVAWGMAARGARAVLIEQDELGSAASASDGADIRPRVMAVLRRLAIDSMGRYMELLTEVDAAEIGCPRPGWLHVSRAEAPIAARLVADCVAAGGDVSARLRPLLPGRCQAPQRHRPPDGGGEAM